MGLLSKFYNEIKARKLRKWIVIHISTSLTILGAINLFSSRYSFPSYVFNTTLVILIFGLFAVMVAAWFHAKENTQKFKLLELSLYSFFLLGALAVIIFYVDFPSAETRVPLESNSIAVLPFENLSDSKENEYFADGVAEDILNNLAKISGLRVISRTSVMNYKNSKKNLREIGKELGVETILEGSIRRSGENIRIVAQLINASSDNHIWSETYDRKLKDIFSIQTEIAEKIASALQMKLLPLEKELIKSNGTKNINAYSFYLKGRDYYYNYTNEDNNTAINLFKKSLDVDPNYALAYAGLADAYNQKVIKYGFEGKWYDSALTNSKKALKIDPNLADGYKALALTYDNLGEKELAMSNYQKAIELNPGFSSAMLNYGQIKLDYGEYDDAFYWFRRANSIEPDNVWVIISIANIYHYLGCNDISIKWGEKAILLEPENSYLQLFLGDLYFYAGNIDKSNRLLSKLTEVKDKKFILGWFMRSIHQAVLGNYNISKEYMDKYLRLSGTKPEYFYAFNLLKLGNNYEAEKILMEEKEEYVQYLIKYPNSTKDYNALAEIYAILNEKEKAFDAWEKAIKKGWLDIDRNTFLPYFENIKGESQYRKLLNIMRKKIVDFKKTIKEKYPQYEMCD